MHLPHGIHLGYCTNIHRGETFEETWRGLRDYTLKVRERVAPGQPYGIGLRLSEQAARDLSAPCMMAEFQEWLEANNCYVFTINGFPYGSFHGTRVKEQVFKPDWTTKERLDYTCLLFDLLAKLLPKGMSGSVSTLPGSHKEFGIGEDELNAIFDNLKACSEHIQRLCDETGHDLHLGLEPEPLGLFETSGETLKFFGLYLDRYPKDLNFFKRVGLNYDCCHLAVEFEEAKEALDRITGAGIRLSKLHLSSALSLQPTKENLERLRGYDEPVYFHQVVVKEGEAPLRRFRDIPNALEMAAQSPHDLGDEWRVHFHIPLHAEPSGGFRDTKDHLLGALDWLQANPTKCQHLEMETYTWEVLPEGLRTGDVVDQLSAEYAWTLGEMKKRGLAA
ncbi:metabolite traffic protein EboE [Roseimicrobium sp. ORNL1]|uniref:metabolite traffic protein EboE n=1 Tax=Roseimicrobium sp. ORNL1 TaxID=2711231 RepID=UPI0013E115BC|nr:metabolite traffic protein EboE [Roseimicrobium sp. ORNL1]QIF04184.1 metabolite traffic protein EboE [Roseimicrobium sp. ORNL1]